MKLLHLADLHLGKSLLEAPLLEEQSYLLDTILDYAGSQGIDAVLLAGDIYDRSVPPAEAVELVRSALAARAGGAPIKEPEA